MWVMLMTCVAMQPGDVGETLHLEGQWSFQLDAASVGERERWFERELADTILLPGSTDERGFGVAAVTPERTRLTREHRHVGPAWYQTAIEIPPSWRGKRVELFLERAMWETKLWVDDHYIGMADSLCVPHRFDLSDYITPGPHRLTLRIDNRLKVNVGHEPPGGHGWSRMWAMCLTEESQTNWNGVIGRMELRASAPVWIERVETHPGLDGKRVRVSAFVRSRVGAVDGEVTVEAACDGHVMGPVTAQFSTKAPGAPAGDDPLSPALADLSGAYHDRRAVTRVDLDLPFGEGARLWDEFDPSVYTLQARLSANVGGELQADHYTDTFGLRTFEADGKAFKLNGRTVFLRGNQDNCIHPKTGYPPMDKASWLDFLGKHQTFGLNHMRFHSWCPPKAAFQAADELGMMIQVECPLWDGHGDVGALSERAAFIRYEAERILDEYGNHPSFCLMSVGNELGDGTELYLQHLVEVLRDRDNRHLYTCTSHPYDPDRNDDYFVSAGGAGGIARGLEHKNGTAYFNYEDTVGGVGRPFIAHEIGQYTSFPDVYSWFNEAKYTGPLKAHYIGMIRERFERFHPPERGPKFAKASGALQVLSYKTELEAMLRTPSLDGFHLNGLMDYPGEGIALIGMLDAMGDSKGLIAPEEFRRFCSETVALVAMKEDELTGGSQFQADAMVRHHGPADIDAGQWVWNIAEPSGRMLFEGSLGEHRIATGGLTQLGKIEASLPRVSEPQELVLTLSMVDSEVMNEWSFWVFPAEVDVAAAEGVMLADAWTDPVRETLQRGGSVVLALDDRTLADPVPCRFWTVFWGRGLFPNIPRPMGLYCDPAHPALDGFPTRSHAQFQWYSLMTGAFAINLNSLPFGFEPVVYMIDDFNECERLGLVFEANVGGGRLVATSLNLGKEGSRTLAQKQMLRSLLTRAGSKDTPPAHELTLAQLGALFQTGETAWQAEQRTREPAPGGPLFVENFTGLEGGGEGRQIATGLALKHSARLSGWRARGFNAVHAVQRSDGTWAFMVLAVSGQDNTLELMTPIAANREGRHYLVQFEAGPTVYEMAGQATRADDEILVEVLRSDGSVLAAHAVRPGPWVGKEAFTPEAFSYEGDGTGGVRLRIAPVGTGGTFFHCAISHLRVLSVTEEEAAKHLPRARRAAASTSAEPYPSKTPRYVFAETLAEQEAQLKTNPLMLRFAESRERFQADRYRPRYHFVSPESQLNDPNGLCFWRGRWHLFYQAYPPDEFPDPADVPKRRQHWGHAVSDDLVRWRDLPYAIYPGTERMCFSGSTVVEDDRVVAFYPGIDAGQMVAIADDPLLLNWDKAGPVNCGVGDSCIWKEGDTYLGLTGRTLWTSKNLQDWENRGEFFSGVEGSCPNFVPIGDKHMILSFSHSEGGQYQLGDYDRANRVFTAYAHGWFNHGKVSPGGVHAPSAAADGKGGVINILNINDAEHSREWDQIMSVAQQLNLGDDQQLRIAPVSALATLRRDHRHVEAMTLPANQELVLPGIEGDCLDIELEADPGMARWLELRVLRSPDAEEYTSITFYNFDRKLSVWYQTQSTVCLDGSRSSTNPDIWLRPPENAPLTRGAEALRLRVLVDRSVVEVFANGRQYLAMRVYPDREDSVGVSLRAQGREAQLLRLDAWRMTSIWE